MKKELKTYIKVSLALLILVELGVTGFWVSYLSQANQGLQAVGIISRGQGFTETTWVNVEIVLSALGWLAIVNAIAILFTVLYIRDSTKLSIFLLLTASLVGSVGLSIRGMLLFGTLSWLFVISIVAATAVALTAILTYRKARTS